MGADLKLIRLLRNETGASLADCKKAVMEAVGDLEQARQIAVRLQAARAVEDEAKQKNKQTKAQDAKVNAEKEHRAQAVAEARRRYEENEVLAAVAAAAALAELDRRITKLQGDPACADLTAPVMLVEAYAVGYKTSAGRMEGRVVRAMRCRGLAEAQGRLCDPELRWSWDHDVCFDENEQSMDSRADLEWWDIHGDDHSVWYRSAPDGSHTFPDLEGNFALLDEQEVKFLMMQ
jgi:DNA-binding transcriptional MerR regulator